MSETGKEERERERETETERRGARAPEHAHTGTMWCSRQGREEGTYPNTRTSPHRLILVFETRGRVVGGRGKGRGTTQTRRTQPGGHVLCV